MMRKLGEYLVKDRNENDLSEETLLEFYTKTASVLAADNIFRDLWRIIYYRDSLPIRAKDKDGKWDSLYLSTVGEDKVIDWLIMYLSKRKEQYVRNRRPEKGNKKA
jgi:hypothetical protein